MKRIWSVMLAAAVLAGCSTGTASSKSAADSSSASSSETADPSKKSDGVMTYAEYDAASADGKTEVTIEAYVQAKQSWWDDEGQGKATLYTQDPDGAYFIYELPIEENDYKKLKEGTKIQVTGYKSEWSGEVEVTDASNYKIENGTWVAEAADATNSLGDEDALLKMQNQKVSFKNLTIAASDDGGDTAYLYNYDGSGTDGDDLYFKASNDTGTYTFTVESYLCDKDSDVYKTVKELKVGDTVDMEGYLYWYEGVNPHITSVTVK